MKGGGQYMVEGLKFLKNALGYDELEIVTEEGKRLAEEIGERLTKGNMEKTERRGYLNRARALIALHKQGERRHARDHGP